MASSAVIAMVAVVGRGADTPRPPGQRPTAAVSSAADDVGVLSAGVACPSPRADIAPVPALAGVAAICSGFPERVDVGSALAGQVTLINLWASWCAPCREEMPVLDAYARSQGAVRVVGVNVQDRPASAAALLADLHVSYPSFVEADGIARAIAAPPLLPLSYVIRADGSVHQVAGASVFGDADQVREAVRAFDR